MKSLTSYANKENSSPFALLLSISDILHTNICEWPKRAAHKNIGQMVQEPEGQDWNLRTMGPVTGTHALNCRSILESYHSGQGTAPMIWHVSINCGSRWNNWDGANNAGETSHWWLSSRPVWQFVRWWRCKPSVAIQYMCNCHWQVNGLVGLLIGWLRHSWFFAIQSFISLTAHCRRWCSTSSEKKMYLLVSPAYHNICVGPTWSAPHLPCENVRSICGKREVQKRILVGWAARCVCRPTGLKFTINDWHHMPLCETDLGLLYTVYIKSCIAQAHVHGQRMQLFHKTKTSWSMN